MIQDKQTTAVTVSVDAAQGAQVQVKSGGNVYALAASNNVKLHLTPGDSVEIQVKNDDAWLEREKNISASESGLSVKSEDSDMRTYSEGQTLKEGLAEAEKNAPQIETPPGEITSVSGATTRRTTGK